MPLVVLSILAPPLWRVGRWWKLGVLPRGDERKNDMVRWWRRGRGEVPARIVIAGEREREKMYVHRAKKAVYSSKVSYKR
jgi:hypothetical protein